jgi:peptidoglycan/LPS O-acetylase OafA/YrhL
MKRVPELDALRGLAALFVALYHLDLQSTWLFRVGWSGVDLFFLLSGFLITTIILKNGDRSGFLWNFYARRSLRIWPIYYLTLMGMTILYALFMKSAHRDGLWLYLLYLQHIPLYWHGVEPVMDMHIHHTWTLAVEEQFYLIWPFLLTLFGRRGLIPIALITVGIAVAMRSLGYPTILLLTRCDSLAIGSLMSLVFLDPVWSERNATPLRMAFSLMLLTCLAIPLGYWTTTGVIPFTEPLLHPTWELLNVELIYAALLGLILTLLGRPILALLRFRWLVGLGIISYGFYLFHTIIFVFSLALARRWGFAEAWWLNLVRMGLAILVAIFSWFLIEKPLLGLKSYFQYDRLAVAPRNSPK